MDGLAVIRAKLRPVLSGVVALLLIAGVVAARSADRDTDVSAAKGAEASIDVIAGDVGISDAQGDPTAAGAGAAIDGSETPDGGPATATAAGGASTRSARARTTPRAAGPGATSAGSATERSSATATSATPLPGVTDKEITVVYYWKGDRTRTSPYLSGSGFEGSVDEAEAFRKLVEFINSGDGRASLMGHKIDLHGRKLKGIVVEAGDNAEDYAAAAERITKEIKPFAAVAAHGSISTYLCPTIAAAGIHNVATYDLAGNLAASTDGYCLPSGMTWEQQVDLTEGYLLRLQKQDPSKVFGVVYAEYPGLVDSAPRMIQRLRRTGVKIAEVATMSASLTTAQQQAANVVARMRAAGVNTVVMPDAGAPINFTHAAQAQGYNPDYYVWPCSGQDTMGMVRLLNASQWARAAGLTCYDASFTSDLTITDQMRKTEWYRAYQSVAPDREPPAPTPFVYAALLPLVAGIEGAGPNLTLETFRGALDRFSPYRYDAVAGRTDAAKNLLLGLHNADRAFLTDAIHLRYNPSRREPGAAAPGTYDFPENRRYASRGDFAA